MITSATRRSTLTITAIVVVTGMVAACGNIAGTRGDGPTTTDARTVAPFTGVDVAAGIALDARIGAVQKVEVQAQRNIVPLITTVVDGGTLKVRASHELDPLVSVSITIVAPDLDAIALGGGSEATVADLTADRLEIAMSGGSELTATGTATAVSVEASGGSEAHLGALAIERLDVEVSGAATVAASVTDEVGGSASGGAQVTISGPARVHVQASGGAEVGPG